MNQRTGEEFCRLGDALGGAGKCVRTITAYAHRMQGLAAGERFEAAIGTLQDLMARVAAMEQDSRRYERALESLRDQLYACRLPAERFSQSVRMFRILSVLTRVETSWLKNSEDGLHTLGDQVESLAAQVAGEAENLQREVRRLEQLAEDTRRQFTTICSQRGAKLSEVLQQGARAVEALRLFRLEAAAAVAALAARYQAMQSDIGTLVVDLQFQDITRQQIEHVCEAFRKIQEEIGPTTLETPEPARLVRCAKLALLQVQQLKKTRTAFMEAVDRIAGAMKDLVCCAGQLASDVAAWEQQHAGTRQDTARRVEEEMTRLTKPLAQCMESGRSLAAALQQLQPGIEQLRSHVAVIDGIRHAITLVALNAAVKTAHLGDQGAAMGVLAVAVQRTMMETSGYSEAVASLLGAIGAIAGELKSGFVADLESDAEGSPDPLPEAPDGTAAAIQPDRSRASCPLWNWSVLLAEQTREIHNTDDAMLEVAAHTRQQALILAETLSRALEGLRCKQLAEAILSDAIDRCQALAEGWMAAAGPSALQGADRSLQASLREAASAYTMQSEREVHAKFCDLASENRPDINSELQNLHGVNESATAGANEKLCAAVASLPGPSAGLVPESEKGNEDFGENVELF